MTKMDKTTKNFIERVLREEEFCKEYLVNCIEHPMLNGVIIHTDDEVIEYCERLARALKEKDLLERTGEVSKYFNIIKNA